MNDKPDDYDSRAVFLRNGAITFGVLLLMFAAFDDITADNATSFPVEYSALATGAVWLLFVATRLLRHHHPILGTVSLLAVCAGAWAQRAIRPGVVPGLWAEYVAMTAAFGWFCALSLTLVWLGWRTHRRRLPRATMQ